jgi:uncharacterized coiled-coil DUF342 family protein
LESQVYATGFFHFKALGLNEQVNKLKRDLQELKNRVHIINEKVDEYQNQFRLSDSSENIFIDGLNQQGIIVNENIADIRDELIEIQSYLQNNNLWVFLFNTFSEFVSLIGEIFIKKYQGKLSYQKP